MYVYFYESELLFLDIENRNVNIDSRLEIIGCIWKTLSLKKKKKQKPHFSITKKLNFYEIKGKNSLFPN